MLENHNEAAQRLISMILDADHAFQDDRCRYKKPPTQLSMIQLKSLLFIQKSRQTNMKDLATYLGVTAPTATVTANQLAEGGLIRRSEDPRDRRLIRLKVTPKAKRNIKEMTRHIYHKIKMAFSKLNQKEIEQFIAIIEKILSPINNKYE